MRMFSSSFRLLRGFAYFLTLVMCSLDDLTAKCPCMQAQYHECLATAAPFCSDPQSAHGKHFQAVMGEAMALLVVFMECLPEQFLACQSISMLDRSTQMPPQAFENVKVTSFWTSRSPDQDICPPFQFTQKHALDPGGKS